MKLSFARVSLMGLAAQSVVVVVQSNTFPEVLCSSYGVPKNACGNKMDVIYQPLSKAVNQEVIADGFSTSYVYAATNAENMALMDAGNANRALRGGDDGQSERRLFNCQANCSGPNKPPFCVTLCPGWRRRDMALPSPVKTPESAVLCSDLTLAAETRLQAMANAMQADDKVCADALMKATCICL